MVIYILAKQNRGSFLCDTLYIPIAHYVLEIYLATAISDTAYCYVTLKLSRAWYNYNLLLHVLVQCIPKTLTL